MRFTMHPQVQAALFEETRLWLAGKGELLEPDGRLFDKSQPRLLCRLVADRLYHRWHKAGLAPFQRETTVLVRAVLEQTPEEFLRDNRSTMSLRQAAARRLSTDLERKFGFPVVIPVGSCSHGPFMTLRRADQVLQRTGIQDGWQLADFLLIGAWISLQDALALRRRLGHEGQQGVLVIGAGQAGMEAAHLAGALGHRLVVASTGQRRQWELERLLGARYHRIDGARLTADLLGQQRMVARVIATHRPDIIITTAKHGSEKAPCLLRAETLEQLPGDTVVVDLNTTRGGNIARSQQDQLLRTDNGVWICNRSNYSNAEPSQASSAYAACLVELLLTPAIDPTGSATPRRSAARRSM
jgi:hypothetical protein